ncbi:iron chaperone [Cellulomonas sp. ICMP 17802]|uniref:iron chaperone n=1 Tax=Cellulomonas sp. ICMP 17802 TaxID=3239199 RepID=UPI00351B276F
MVREGYPAASVEEYLDLVPPDQGAALRVVRDRLVAVVPDAEQVISYQVPTIRYRGAGLVALSVAKEHCSLHLMSPPLARSLAGTLTEGRLSGATLHFDAATPLSEATVRLVATRRMAEVDARLDH